VYSVNPLFLFVLRCGLPIYRLRTSAQSLPDTGWYSTGPGLRARAVQDSQSRMSGSLPTVHVDPQCSTRKTTKEYNPSMPKRTCEGVGLGEGQAILAKTVIFWQHL
jgi:hypothetical protein